MSSVLSVSTINPSLSWNSIVPRKRCGWSESFRSLSFQAYLDQVLFDSVTRVSTETMRQSFSLEEAEASVRGLLLGTA